MSEISEIIHSVLQKDGAKIEEWFREKAQISKPFLFTSVDIRHSGKKIVPVDTNLFPAGFALMCEEQVQLTARMVKQHLDKYYPNTHRVLIIAESHSRNIYYLRNIAALKRIFEIGGYAACLARIDITEPLELEVDENLKLNFIPLMRDGDYIRCPNYQADIIVVNNDLSSGAPVILKGVKQPVLPPPGMGWYRRRKTKHYETYENLTREFSSLFGLDHFLITSMFEKCSEINFKKNNGLNCVANYTDRLIARLREKYIQHGITQEPYVFIKANSGTYGMGIMVVKSGEEVLAINKKERHSMNVIKEGVENTEVVVQEGIETIDFVNGKTAETMVYLVGHEAVSFNHRINEIQDAYGNLNSKGMSFVKFDETNNKLFEANRLVARLSALAANLENYEANWQI